jgi:AGZA family xanthine/uracil permease-like MFS transporter
MIALERGFLFTSMILAAMAASLIDGERRRAAGWAAAALSWLGVIHAFEITPGGVISPIGWGKAPALAGGYLIMAALFAAFAVNDPKKGKTE